jgi:type VI secretion system secreted protein VgrG
MTESTPRKTLATTVLGDDVLKLHSLKGHEALSEPFRFSVTLVTKDEKSVVDLAVLLGTVVHVTVDQESTAVEGVSHPERYFNGYVTEVSREILPSARWLYTVELRPWLWLLGKTRNCRIFQNMSVPEIVAKVFTDREFKDYELRLEGTYPKREYCVQYRESDLDFVSRLLEHEGIYYYFEFDAQKHLLVVTDDTARHEPRPSYETIECSPTFVSDPSGETFGGRIYDWRPKKELRADLYVLKDYDFLKPTVNVEGKESGTVMVKGTSLEKFDYPGGFTEPSIGKEYATVRMLEERVQGELRQGKATSHGLAPGYLFTMARNKDSTQNVTYLTVRAEYEIAVAPYVATTELRAKPWNCQFSALESSIQFRPARVTPRPVIAGLQTAKVVGGSSEEILTDEYGRIKVQFHWDRADIPDESRSCFIRTAQMWAGPNWGTQHIPRVGHEVVVSFLEGDPDQPLIVGSVYNGLNLPPFTLPAQKEVSGVKSKSTLNGGTRYNELSLDDTKGKEVVNLHAQYNMRTVVENERYTKVGGDDTEVVKGNQYVAVTQTYALNSLVSTELVCGPSIIKLTPFGISIKALQVDIEAPIFSLMSANAMITPAVYTMPLGPRPWVSGPPPLPTPAPNPEDNVGGKRAIPALGTAAAAKPPLAVNTGMPENGLPSPPPSP